ncbi:MAG: SdpI family protein [Erysipelotrichaceae bacterium]
MNHKTKPLYIFALITLVLTLCLYPFLPESIPMHFNASGAIDSYGHKATVFLFPALVLGLPLLAVFLQKVDPKKEQYQLFQNQYWNLMFFLQCFFFFMEAIVILSAFDPALVNINAIMMLLLSLLLIFIGNMMPKFKSNYFVGIKTPWTLASTRVWYKTHRFAGKLWFFGGFILLLGFVLPSELQLSFFLVVLFVITLIPIVYSYVIYKGEQKHD